MSSLAIVDYGAGNLGSLRRAFELAGCSDIIAVSDPSQLDAERGLVVPGVGAFAAGMARLRSLGWTDAIHDAAARERTIIGICAGMQFLATDGTEGGAAAGLDLIAGKVVQLDVIGCQERLPHVGWNAVTHSGSRIFDGLPAGVDFYFSHRYAFVPDDPSSAVGHVHYGVDVTAAVSSGRIHGIQFHPEKSSFAGIRVLENLVRSC